jgi:hypothetical protein
MKWDREAGTVKVQHTEKLHAADRLKMRIAIPSMGRADTVRTLAMWPKEWLPSTYLVVPLEESAAYKLHWPGVKQVMVDPQMANGIAATRQYIWEQAKDVEYVCQVSDDLRFAYRDENMKLHGATELHVRFIFDLMLRLLMDGWMHVGLSARAGNNHVPHVMKAVGRMCDVYAHRHHDCRKLGVRWDRKVLQSDFDVTLQLLRLGHPNAIIYNYCWDQQGSNAQGGCSLYRTPEMLERESSELERLHPGFVQCVTRPAGNWKGDFGEERTDVRVQWQKALQSWGLRPGLRIDQLDKFAGDPHWATVVSPPKKKRLVKKKLLRKKGAPVKKTIKRKG